MSPSNREIFANNLNRLIQLKGVNQADVATALKVSRTAVSEWSRALKYPRIDTMQRLADYFEVPMQSLTLEQMRCKKGGIKVASIIDVAEWFLNKQPMSQKKLQKMCYYAQAWSYALLNDGIADDGEFEAWVHGPVSRILYRKYKGKGWEDLYPSREAPCFDEKTTELLESVFLTYGNMSANALEVLSHNELPWRNARTGCYPLQKCSNLLSEEDMKSYYLSIYSGDDA